MFEFLKQKPTMIKVGPLDVGIEGSLQNPAWSPDGKSIVFTRFRKGYNEGPADIFIYDFATKTTRVLVSDGSDNVSQPGSCWNAATDFIVFTSDRVERDEVWAISASGDGIPWRITNHVCDKAYEPSWAPDASAIVFEAHYPGSQRGSIVICYRNERFLVIEQGRHDADCRQPNWSPDGQSIVYQKMTHGIWELWLYDVKTKYYRMISNATPGDRTDATFSPKGTHIVFSGARAWGDNLSAGLWVVAVDPLGMRSTPLPLRVDYYGAPSWHPNLPFIICETYPGDPDGSKGTTLDIVAAPVIDTI